MVTFDRNLYKLINFCNSLANSKLVSIMIASNFFIFETNNSQVFNNTFIYIPVPHSCQVNYILTLPILFYTMFKTEYLKGYVAILERYYTFGERNAAATQSPIEFKFITSFVHRP